MDRTLIALVLVGGVGVVVASGLALVVHRWARRRRAFTEAAPSLGFAVLDGRQPLLAEGFEELRAAAPGQPGVGRFENVLSRRSESGVVFVFDYSAGGTSGTALLPQGTYVCFLEPSPARPRVRLTPRPAPDTRLARRLIRGTDRPALVDVDPPSTTTDHPGGGRSDFERLWRTYSVQALSAAGAAGVLTRERVAFLLRLDPPWLAEMGPAGLLLGKRPRGPGGIRRFHHLEPSELGPFTARAGEIRTQLLQGR